MSSGMEGKLKLVVATWSGGIDSTAVLGNLLRAGWNVLAVTLHFYEKDFVQREKAARDALRPELEKLGSIHGGSLTCIEREAPWIWAFSNDGKEIPRRNKHIMDHLIVTEMQPRGIFNLAMGEYVGADTWLVRDHVGASDADHRALEAYLYLEYGIDYRLISLRDFGESRFKSHRLKLGLDAGVDMSLTTNCLENLPVHCGRCYKCVERAAAFDVLEFPDKTVYQDNPRRHPKYSKYALQMTGQNVRASFQDFQGA